MDYLADGDWQASFLLVLDLVPHEGGRAASRASIVPTKVSHRVGQVRTTYRTSLDDPQRVEDLDGDMVKESVFITRAEQRVLRPATKKDVEQWSDPEGHMDWGVDVGDIIEEVTVLHLLVIVGEDMSILMWNAYDSEQSESSSRTVSVNYDQTAFDPHYEITDIGLGRTVFVYWGAADMEVECTDAEGEKDQALIEVQDAPSYMFFDGQQWDVIFAWTLTTPPGRPCDEYPVAVSVSLAASKKAKAPLVYVDLFYEKAERDATEVWKYDGTRYVLAKTRKD